jgi:hypothetical protein
MRLLAARRRGGIMVIVAGGLTALIGFGALVCDVGLAMAQRTRMQMAADAAALAAVKHIKKSESWAKLEAITVAKLNGYNIKGTDINIDPNRKEVGVKWQEPTGFVLGPVLNRFGVKVGVNAVAGLVSIQEQIRVAPFLVPEDRIVVGSVMKIKYGAGDSAQGNFGGAAIDGNGAKVYQSSIVDGAKTPLRTGMFVDTEPGDMVGPTDKGVNALIAGDDTPYEDALIKSNRRLITVLLVDGNEFRAINGKKPVMIRGFARFYLMGAKNGVVEGRFIDTFFGKDAPPPNEMRAKLVK